MKGYVKMKLIKQIELQKEIIIELKEFVKFMDYYFSKEENIKAHYSIYLAYENMSNQIIRKANQKGLK